MGFLAMCPTVFCFRSSLAKKCCFACLQRRSRWFTFCVSFINVSTLTVGLVLQTVGQKQRETSQGSKRDHRAGWTVTASESSTGRAERWSWYWDRVGTPWQKGPVIRWESLLLLEEWARKWISPILLLTGVLRPPGAGLRNPLVNTFSWEGFLLIFSKPWGALRQPHSADFCPAQVLPMETCLRER